MGDLTQREYGLTPAYDIAASNCEKIKSLNAKKSTKIVLLLIPELFIKFLLFRNLSHRHDVLNEYVIIDITKSKTKDALPAFPSQQFP